MSDFFREVDEELRNDRMHNIWKNYGKLFIGGIVLVVLATAAYRYYIYWVDSQAGISGDKYLQALQLIEDGDRDGGQKLLSELEADGFGGYPILARFKAAAAVLGGGDKPTAIKAFDALADEGSIPEELRDYARLQAAIATVDIGSYDDVKKRTETLLGDDNPWRHLAREALALSAWKGGRVDEAAKWVYELKRAVDIPQGLRQRVQLLEELVVGAGGKIQAAG
ncbi:MAG: tetratricopeptide repeat protein [Hyphomicrobiales bacterium]